MKLETEMMLSHMSVSVEKNGDDDGDSAVTLKFKREMIEIEELRGLFSTKAGYKACVEDMYREDGELVTGDIGKVSMSREGCGVNASIKSAFGNVVEYTDGAVFDGISYELVPGKKANLSCSLYVYPKAGDPDLLLAMLKKSVRLSVHMKESDIVKQKAQQQRDLALKTGEMPEAFH